MRTRPIAGRGDTQRGNYIPPDPYLNMLDFGSQIRNQPLPAEGARIYSAWPMTGHPYNDAMAQWWERNLMRQQALAQVKPMHDAMLGTRIPQPPMRDMNLSPMANSNWASVLQAAARRPIKPTPSSVLLPPQYGI